MQLLNNKQKLLLIPFTDSYNEIKLLLNEDINASFKEEASEKGNDFIPLKDREIIALIGYLQRLGTDIKVKETVQN